jgi:hypothetical protein
MQQSGEAKGTSFNSMIKTFYTSLIIIGIIVLFSTVGTTSMGSLTGTIVGFSLICAGIALIICLLLYNIFANQHSSGLEYQRSNNSNSSLLMDKRTIYMTMLYTTGPFLVLLLIVGYIIYLINKYKVRISEGNVAPGYVSFTNVSILLIMLQLWLFYSAMQQKNFKATGRLDRVYSMLLYFIGIINIVSVITLYIILARYSTDG